MKALRWTARCQTQDLPTQYFHGARCFDVRVRFKDNGAIVAAHGLVEFDGDVHVLLDELIGFVAKYNPDERLTFRLVLETSRRDREDVADFCAFATWLAALSRSYHAPATIICGRRKGDWARLLDCGEPITEQHVGSMRAWYGKVWPWLWWHIHRDGEATARIHDDNLHLYDFI